MEVYNTNTYTAISNGAGTMRNAENMQKNNAKRLTEILEKKKSPKLKDAFSKAKKKKGKKK